MDDFRRENDEIDAENDDEIKCDKFGREWNNDRNNETKCEWNNNLKEDIIQCLKQENLQY